MKSLLASSLLALALFAVPAVLAEQTTNAPAEKPAQAPTTQPMNKMCPVHTENAVDDRVTIQYEGKTIGFCCSDCVADFKKNPEKYTKGMK